MNQNIKNLHNKHSAHSNSFKTLVVMLIFMLLLFASQITIVSATPAGPPAPVTPYDWENWETSSDINSFGRAIFGFAYDVYSGESLFSSDAVQALTVDFNSGAFVGVWNAIEFIYSGVATTGMLLLTLYWLLELLEKVQSDSFTLEHFVRASIKLIVGILLMSNGMALFRGILSAVNILLSNISASGVPPGSASVAILQQVWDDCVYQEKHIFKGSAALIGWCLKLIIPALAMMLIKVVIYVVLYSRMIELFVRTAFAPIGMANIYTGGLNSTGFKYVKKIAAVAFAGCVIIVILLAYIQLSGIINDPLNPNNPFRSAGVNPISQLVLGFTVITLIIKAQSWSNDIIGV